MIYPVVVKKLSGGRYAAYCPMTDSIFAAGNNVRDVLDDVMAQFSCRVHDSDASIDVIFADTAPVRHAASAAKAPSAVVCALFAAVLAVSTGLCADAKPGPADVASEINNLKKNDSSRKLEALGRLRGTGDKKAGAAIAAEAKKEKNSAVRARMIEALGNFKQKEAADTALDALKNDASAEVRFSAAYALSYIAGDDCAPALIKTFTDENERKGVRFQAAAALASLRPAEEIIAVFLTAAESEDPEVRAQAVTSLSVIAPDDPRSSALARKMLADRDEFVKKTAAARLEFMGAKQ